MVVLGGIAVSYERSCPVARLLEHEVANLSEVGPKLTGIGLL